MYCSPVLVFTEYYGIAKRPLGAQADYRVGERSVDDRVGEHLNLDLI